MTDIKYTLERLEIEVAALCGLSDQHWRELGYHLTEYAKAWREERERFHDVVKSVINLAEHGDD